MIISAILSSSGRTSISSASSSKAGSRISSGQYMVSITMTSPSAQGRRVLAIADRDSGKTDHPSLGERLQQDLVGLETGLLGER